MTLATPPPDGEPASGTADGLTDRAVHGILIGCVTCAPFWLALLVATLR